MLFESFSVSSLLFIPCEIDNKNLLSGLNATGIVGCECPFNSVQVDNRGNPVVVSSNINEQSLEPVASILPFGENETPTICEWASECVIRVI